MEVVQPMTAFGAFQYQLRTLCLHEFPCGMGPWKETYGKKIKDTEKGQLNSQFASTLKDYGANNEKTESLEELVSSKTSPWNLDYSWSNEAKELREIAVRSPWLIDEHFVHNYFKTLQIVDKNVTEIDESLKQFSGLEELSLSANHIEAVKSTNLPTTLKVLELCANNISDLSELCLWPPPCLNHLGLGYNNITIVNDYITGQYWPKLLSLDLSHNNLQRLMDIIRKLQTLPRLKNLILQGNPLTLIPGYRGYTIDSLRRLSFLDDVSISADEKHHFKGLAKRQEFITDQAKVVLHVSSIKGIPMPEEMKNPEEQPEFPVVTRKYYIQFMFLEDAFKEVEKVIVPEPDPSVAPASPIAETTTSNVEPRLPTIGACVSPEEIVLCNTELQPVMAKSERPSSQAASIAKDTIIEEPEKPEKPEKPDALPAGLKLVSIKSASGEWAEELELNWTKTVVRDDLLSMRDFCKQGMTISLMEEKVESFPADHINGVPSPPASAKSREGGKKDDKKSDKKDAKGKDKGKDDKATKKEEKKKDKKKEKADEKKKKNEMAKGKTSPKNRKPKGKGKKKGEPEAEMTAMPAEYTSLRSFHVTLIDFLDGDFLYKNVFSHEWQDPLGSGTSEVSSKQKDKAVKRAASAKKKDAKPEKDGRGKNDKKGKGKQETEEDGSGLPPRLEVDMWVKLDHWRSTVDSTRPDENSDHPPEDAAQIAQPGH